LRFLPEDREPIFEVNTKTSPWRVPEIGNRPVSANSAGAEWTAASSTYRLWSPASGVRILSVVERPLRSKGKPPNGRFVVIEFKSLAAPRSFYYSSEYQAVAPLRLRAARSRAFLVEGSS